jgi:hypothetical protein
MILKDFIKKFATGLTAHLLTKSGKIFGVCENNKPAKQA